MRTLKDIESEEDELYAELDEVAKAATVLRGREEKIRTKLQHLEIERVHLSQLK